MANVGKLVVELAASTAAFQSDLGKAVRIAESNSQRIGRAFGTLKTAAASIGGAFAAGQIIAWSNEAIKAAEDLQDLADATGSTVESLSRLSNITKIGGGNFDEIKGALERLAAGMAGAEEGSSKTAAALQFLQIRAKDPALALEEIAKKLNTFADGTGKAAIARDLFGRSGVGFLASLKDIAEKGDVAATVTTKQAEEASKLAESYRALGVHSSAVGKALLNDVVPALNAVTGKLQEAIKLSGGFVEGLIAVTRINPFQNASDNLERLQRQLAEAEAAKYNEGSFSKFFNEVTGKSWDKTIAGLKGAIALIEQAEFNKGLHRSPFKLQMPEKPQLPYRSDGAAKALKDDPTKKLLDGQLKALAAATEQEREILRTRLEFLDRYNEAGFLTFKEYFDQKAEAQREDLRVTLAGFDAEIAALTKYRDERAKSQTEVAETDNKIAELAAKRAKAEQEAGKASVLAWFDQQRAAADYTRTLDELRAKLLEIQGDTAGAAALRLRGQNAGLRSEIERRGDVGALADLDKHERLTKLQTELNATSREFGNLMEGLGIQVERVGILRESGALGEIEALQKVSELNRAKLADLVKIADAYARIAQASGDPAAINAAQRAQNEIAKLAQQTDLAGDKFRAIFRDAFADNLVDFVNGTKSAKDAMKSFADDVVQNINRIAAQRLSEALFGGQQGGSGGLLGGIIAKLFGSLFGGSSGGLGYGTIGSAIPDGPYPYANGTDWHPGGLALVGERGPELLRLPRGAAVVPNHELRIAPMRPYPGSGWGHGSGGGVVNVSQTINVLPGATTQSARQAASRVRDATILAIKDR